MTPQTVAHQAPLSIEFFQARILKWVAISFSRGSSWPKDQTQVSCIGRWILYHWATWEADHYLSPKGDCELLKCWTSSDYGMHIGVCRESVVSLLEKHTLRSASKIQACSFSLSSTASLFSPLYISPPCFHFLFLLPGVAKPGLLYCLTLESTISIVFSSCPLGSGGGWQSHKWTLFLKLYSRVFFIILPFSHRSVYIHMYTYIFPLKMCS